MTVWLASWPRSGNTHFRMLVKHYFGLETGSAHADKVFSYGELKSIVGHAPKSNVLVKTHRYHTDKLPAIYLVRDGRQACLSYWHHLRGHGGKQSLQDVIRGKTDFGAWSDHVLFWLKRVPEPTIVKFEEVLGKDDPAFLREVLASVGIFKEPITSEPPPSFQSLHERNPRFFRSGRTDEWREVYGPDDLELFNKLNGRTMAALGYMI